MPDSSSDKSVTARAEIKPANYELREYRGDSDDYEATREPDSQKSGCDKKWAHARPVRRYSTDCSTNCSILCARCRCAEIWTDDEPDVKLYFGAGKGSVSRQEAEEIG